MAETTQGRPGPQGMTQGTYTGNVLFSRGMNDLIAKPANLPSVAAAKPQASAPVQAAPAPAPSGPSFGTAFTFNNNGNAARGY